MKRIGLSILTLLTLLVLKINGQVTVYASTPDSLKQAYNKAPQTVAGALNALNLAKWYNHNGMFDSALNYANLGIATAKKLKRDSILGQLYRSVGNINSSRGNYPEALASFQQALKVTDSVKDRIDEAKLYNNIGNIEEKQASYSKAYCHFKKALNLFIKINDTRDVSATYNNIALIFHDQGNNARAIEYNLMSLSILESMKEPYLTANALNNIGNIYRDQKQDSQALTYYNQALAKFQGISNKQGIATSNNNIGMVYMDQEDYDKALQYFNNSLGVLKDLGLKRDIANCYGDIGSTYLKKGDPKQAIENDQKALDLYKAIGDQQGVSQNMNQLALAYFAMDKYIDAQKEGEGALAIANDINSPRLISDINDLLSQVYEKNNQPGKALKSYKIFDALRDSLDNEDNTRKIITAQLAHQFEKEQEAQTLENEKKAAVADEAARRQRAVLYFVISILVLVIGFAGFMVNRFYVIHRQKKIIIEQKEEVVLKNKVIEEKNKDITDSINYARDIQRALMPGEQDLRRVFPESFVLYLPKDIVSGDFYWMSEKDGKTLLLAADCTGHGVPGALMSMIGVSLFNEAVEKKDIIEPGSILSEVRKGIINTFRQKGDSKQHRDGMDAALCSIDQKTLKIDFAGAYNPLWIVNKNGEVKEVTPDKQPVGIQEGQRDTFTTQSFQLEKGDIMYIFSDGYADQFGGPSGKKFKYKQFHDLLLSAYKLAMGEQKALLEKTFNDWKGNLEQVDDVLILGIRV